MLRRMEQRLGHTGLTPAALSDSLAPHGYVLSFFARKMIDRRGRLGFVRRSISPSAFEQVFLHIVATDVLVRVRVSMVPTANHWDSIVCEETLTARGSDDGIRQVRTSVDREVWRNEILARAPDSNRRLAQTEMPGLLERSQRARSASTFYLSRLPRPIHDLQAFWNAQKAMASDGAREAARRMLPLPMLDLPFNNQDEEDRAFWCYQIAAYTIVLNEAVGVQHGFFEQTCDPFECDDLGACLQIMASRLHGHPLWEEAPSG